MPKSDFPAVRPTTYVSPLKVGISFTFVPPREVYPYFHQYTNEKNTYFLRVSKDGTEIDTREVEKNQFGETGDGTGITLTLSSGKYQAFYSFTWCERGNLGGGVTLTNTATFTFYVVENQYPLKKQTVLDVINRLLAVVEPLVGRRNGNGEFEYVKPPRFHFAYVDYDPTKPYDEQTADGKEEYNLFNQTSPEFTFTRQTLREALQQIGKFIHAEPRLRNKNEIIFDRYGGQELATYTDSNGNIIPLNKHPYMGKRFRHSSAVASTTVESEVDNFVNRLDKTGGTISVPYRGGALTLRTQTAYLRIEDAEGETCFPVPFGIMDVTSFKWIDSDGTRYDITPYVFEKTIYDANLSSYNELYPRSKAYGLYFAQGDTAIRGFFYKSKEATGGVLADFAIKNIIERATGKNLGNKPNYQELCFELVYTPMYSARLSHGKSYTGDMLKKPFVLMYNQSANVVETRYYGEHLKGVAERLGNAQKTVSMIVRSPRNIPECGQLWDKDYYISGVKGKIIPIGIALNIELTKKYNRLSEFVGANSYQRYYEVSERMSQERRMIYKDYFLITQMEKVPDNKYDCFVSISEVVMPALANTFYQNDNPDNRILGSMYDPYSGIYENFDLPTAIVSCVSWAGYSKSFNPVGTEVLLPVVSSAFGNTMEYTWSFKDNYSAGIGVVSKGSGNVTGYFGTEVTYGDYYGRVYYEQWRLGSIKEGNNLQAWLDLPKDFSREQGGMKPFFGSRYMGPTEPMREIQKDSREVLSESYSIEFVTDIEGIIIGSALARNNPTIGGVNTGAAASLYILPRRVNQFSNGRIDLTDATKVYSYTDDFNYGKLFRQIEVATSYTETVHLNFKGIAAPKDGKAWAIVSGGYVENHLEEDENGKVENVAEQFGGELLLAFNGDIKKGDTIGKFKITPIHDIFEIVNKGV